MWIIKEWIIKKKKKKERLKTCEKKETREVNIAWSLREMSEKGCVGISYIGGIIAQAILKAKLWSSEVKSSHL